MVSAVNVKADVAKLVVFAFCLVLSVCSYPSQEVVHDVLRSEYVDIVGVEPKEYSRNLSRQQT